jgi:hypothetical protein
MAKVNVRRARSSRDRHVAVDLLNTDWDTVDLRKLRAQFDAEQLAAEKVTREQLDRYGDASFDAALAVLGIVGPPETVDTIESVARYFVVEAASAGALIARAEAWDKWLLPLRGLDNTPCE